MRIIKYGKNVRRTETECSNCHSVYEYTPSDIAVRWEFSIVRTYVSCPVCKKEHILDIRNASTNEIMYSNSVLWGMEGLKED